jgi:hypothetical protein
MRSASKLHANALYAYFPGDILLESERLKSNSLHFLGRGLISA